MKKTQTKKTKPTLVEEPLDNKETKSAAPKKARPSKSKRAVNPAGQTYSGMIKVLVEEGKLENDEIKKLVAATFPDRDHKWTGQLIAHHRWMNRTKKEKAA
jgi:hypothetical protein